MRGGSRRRRGAGRQPRPQSHIHSRVPPCCDHCAGRLAKPCSNSGCGRHSRGIAIGDAGGSSPSSPGGDSDSHSVTDAEEALVGEKSGCEAGGERIARPERGPETNRNPEANGAP